MDSEKSVVNRRRHTIVKASAIRESCPSAIFLCSASFTVQNISTTRMTWRAGDRADETCTSCRMRGFVVNQACYDMYFSSIDFDCTIASGLPSSDSGNGYRAFSTKAKKCPISHPPPEGYIGAYF